jgi:hypothetical protein
MLRKGILTLGTVLLLYAAAAAEPEPGLITGTFSKGPAVGGTEQFIGPNVLLVLGEKGFGQITGGVLTGSAVYKFKEEILDFAAQIGTFEIHLIITKANGSSITLGLVGFTSGVTPTAQTVTVNGTWVVLSDSGHDSKLHGEGQFTGSENFLTGETQGTFIGLIRTAREEERH